MSVNSSHAYSSQQIRQDCWCGCSSHNISVFRRQSDDGRKKTSKFKGLHKGHKSRAKQNLTYPQPPYRAQWAQMDYYNQLPMQLNYLLKNHYGSTHDSYCKLAHMYSSLNKNINDSKVRTVKINMAKISFGDAILKKGRRAQDEEVSTVFAAN